MSPAARALGLPKSTLSRHVALLEQALDAKLLVRAQREVRLTDAGAVLVAGARAPLAALDEAAADASALRTAPRGRVRLAAPADYGSAVVSPIVVGLLEAHSDIDIELLLSDEVVDLRRGHFDLAVRIGPVRDESLIARPLGLVRGLLVASPAYLRRHKALATATTPDALTGHPCLVFNAPPFSNVWRLEGAHRDATEVSVHGPLMVNGLTVVRAAAIAGLGVARLPLYLCREDIEARRLAVVLPGWSTPSRTVSLVYADRRLTPRVRAAISYFSSAAAERRFD